jgi:hypothetical protein
MDNVVGLYTGKDPEVVNTTTDNGAFALPVERKRDRGTPGEQQKNDQRPKLMHKVKVERCCQCTDQLTCQRLCACKKAGRKCIDCNNFGNCFNCDIPKESRFICPEVQTPGADITPKILNFLTEDKKEDKSKATRGAAPQSTPNIQTDKEEAEEEDEEEEEEQPVNNQFGDLPGVEMTAADKILHKVYGDHVHQNDGTHLDGGISDDKIWQERWRKISQQPCLRYDAPNGAVGKRFVTMLATELAGIVERKWNSDRFVVFQAVILQKHRDVKGAGDIRKRINNRLDSWANESFAMLVQDTQRTALSQLSRLQGTETEEQRAKTFNRLILQGKIRAGVRYVTEREKGGVLLPSNKDEKKGEGTVLEALKEKHPEPRFPEPHDFEEYEEVPDFVKLDVTEEVVGQVAARMSGSAGPGGSDAQSVQHWLLRHGQASQLLRKAVRDFVDWQANGSPPWAAYRALKAGRLVALDKCPGIRPVGIGETWSRLFAKCVLSIAKSEAKEACGVDQLCGGLEAGIEGGIHAMRSLWKAHEEEEKWGFLLVDARNAFNEGNRMAMLWTVRHRWPSGARFTFNCYRHWAILIVRAQDGLAIFLFSKEGVTQGDPLAMIIYGILLLPLIQRLKNELPTVDQPWYADDAGAGGTFPELRAYVKALEKYGPTRGYFPEPTKSILIVREHNLAAAKIEFKDLGFEVVSGARYLGGFLGEDSEQKLWIEEKTSNWTDAVRELAKVAVRYPQTAYAGLTKSLQQEMQFVQRVTSELSDEFIGVQKALQEDFIPALFGNVKVDDIPGQLACLPIKKAGLAILDPTLTAVSGHTASEVICGHIIGAILGKKKYRSAEHKATMLAGIGAYRVRHLTANQRKLDSILKKLPPERCRTILRGEETGAWLSSSPSIVNGTELSTQEFRDALHMRYGITPPDLPLKCDGCDQHFTLQHALSCKKGGLVIFRHNEIRDELVYLAGKAFTPSAIRDEPLIHPCRVAKEDKKSPTSITSQPVSKSDRGDIFVRGLWDPQTGCILDVRVTDLDQPSQISMDPAKVLRKHENEKKRKYLQPCLDQRRHFSPFVVSTDGMLGREASCLIKRLSQKLATKWQRPLSHVTSYVRTRLSIAIVRATHLCMRGSRIPAHSMSTRRPLWEDGAGLALFDR